MRRESFAPFELVNQAFVERQELFEPPVLAGDQSAPLQVKPFEQQVAHDLKAGMMGDCMKSFHVEGFAIGNDGQLNQTFTDVPGAQPKGRYPHFQNMLTQVGIGQKTMDGVAKAVGEHMPAVLGNQAFPATNIGLRRAERFRDLRLRKQWGRGPDALQPAQEQDEHPLFESIARFPDELEGTAPSDRVAIGLRGGDADFGVGVGLRDPGREA